MQRQAAQRHRMNRVVNYAQLSLGEALDLDQLAEVACLSKYHFARAFVKHYSDPPVKYLWRLRLEFAARGLLFRHDRSISDIALDCGFSSPQTFSRAFQRSFGMAPRALRQDPAKTPAWGPRAADAALIKRWEQTPVTLQQRPALRLAYIRHIGPYWNSDGGICRTFRALKDWAKGKGLWSKANAVIGHCPNNADITPANACIYDACLPVPDALTEDNVVSIQTIPDGLYAVMPVTCSSREMESAWKWLTSAWLAESGQNYALNHSYEIYPLVSDRAITPQAGAMLCMRLS